MICSELMWRKIFNPNPQSHKVKSPKGIYRDGKLGFIAPRASGSTANRGFPVGSLEVKSGIVLVPPYIILSRLIWQIIKTNLIRSNIKARFDSIPGCDTATTNLHVATFPAASLKLIVTAVDPRLKACPEL